MVETTPVTEEPGFLDSLTGGLRDAFSGATDGITGFFSDIGDGLGSLRDDAMDLISNLNPLNALGGAMQPVMDFVRSIVELVQGAIKWATGNDSDFGNEFLQTIEGLIPGTAPEAAPTDPRLEAPAPAP